MKCRVGGTQRAATHGIRRLLKLEIVMLAVSVLHAAPAFADGEDAGSALQSSSPPVSPLEIRAQPIFGHDTPAPFGWVPYVVTLTNHGPAPITGEVRLESPTRDAKKRAHVHAHSRFALAPLGVTQLQLPTHDAASSGLEVTALLDDQAVVHVDAGGTTPLEPLLVDLNRPSHLKTILGGAAILTRYVPTPYWRYSSPELAVATLETSPLHGSSVLPEHPAGYASATLVVGSSSRILALDSSKLGALLDWVVAGGSLAIGIDRNADLAATPLQALVGAEIERQTEPSDLGTDFLVPDPKQDSRQRRGVAPLMLAPSTAIQRELSLYRGGNLRPSPWGTSASYGLGEVHLLAFDPANPTHLADRWVALKLQTLTAYAWDRGAQLVFPLGSGSLEDHIAEELRSALDTDRDEIWVILLAGMIVLGYALIAGPVNFYLARRSGRIFGPLWRVPAFAAVTSLVILVVGMGKAGGSSRSHRLTLIEAGAGMTRGAATRYRAFLSAQTETLAITATEVGGLFDVIGPRQNDAPSLEVSPQGLRLERFPNRPWETRVVREDGLLDLDGGISIQRDGSELSLRNKTHHDLLGVVLHVPGGELRFFPRIAAGEHQAASNGQILSAGAGAAVRAVHGLAPSTFRHAMDRAAPGASDAWTLLDRASRRSVDWWPADVPVLLAELDSSSKRRDSGFPVEVDRTLIRVVGYGGAP